MCIRDSDYDGVNYQEIVSQLEEAGFTNIREEPLGDFVTGWLNDEGEVDEVSVDGDTGFSTDSRYLPDVEIVVSYHTFPGEEESSTEDEDSNSERNEEESFEVMDAFVEAGGNFIDTANVYCRWVPGAGNCSERFLGLSLIHI